ncbi:4a-hydroxytetrahydrobiopterin dehydratase [Fluviicola sp.]|uniref:4a-hydroxytetrahydrobiopterin dehydratase n=1 Tax=Fluviicola sp. TaxID=1917219 RepID=UPI003D2B7641
MNWNILANQFRTVVQFDNQTELAKFVLLVAQLADQLDHHPDMEIKHCNELSISVYSHDRQKITQRDHKLVDGISELYKDWKTKKADE